MFSNGITNWAEQYNVYFEAQPAFRSEMGTIDNIFNLQGLITHLLNNGKKLFFFSKYINILKQELQLNGLDGIDIGTLKFCYYTLTTLHYSQKQR